MENMNPLDAAISPIRLQLRALVEMQLIRAVFSGSQPATFPALAVLKSFNDLG
jgi:hypothetical protein